MTNSLQVTRPLSNVLKFMFIMCHNEFAIYNEKKKSNRTSHLRGCDQ